MISHNEDEASQGRLKLFAEIYRQKMAARPPMEILARYAAMPSSELEQLEGLEQLRFLAAGVPVDVVAVETPPFVLRELNNPEDVAPIEAALAKAGLE